MFSAETKKALVVAVVTDAVDFTFHYFLTHPMESLTYFVVKFLLAFFIASFLFGFVSYVKSKGWKNFGIGFVFALIFSTLMSVYYRAWELGEAQVPFGSRAPEIYGIARDNLVLFSGTWWLGHALFFVIGVFVANKIISAAKKKN
ncbi:MAG: hypothetical protein Q8P62_04355 [Candidatus Peregrinibacteria bacterium]|nr:hypothetical protein [Candidatus Peregrinibacteria bacterium]